MRRKPAQDVLGTDSFLLEEIQIESMLALTVGTLGGQIWSAILEANLKSKSASSAKALLPACGGHAFAGLKSGRRKRGFPPRGFGNKVT